MKSILRGAVLGGGVCVAVVTVVGAIFGLATRGLIAPGALEVPALEAAAMFAGAYLAAWGWLAAIVGAILGGMIGAAFHQARRDQSQGAARVRLPSDSERPTPRPSTEEVVNWLMGQNVAVGQGQVWQVGHGEVSQ